MTDLCAMDALELSLKIARRELSPVELMRATLARIDAVNGDVNAIVSLRDREVLMGEARLAEAMPPEGWLHGIPVAVKDLVDVKGVPSTSGAPFLAGHVPAVDDGLVRRLKAAGAIVLGKTNVPQFGLGSHSKNPVFGVTRNPFDLTRSAGGSSGGAAAALATGMVSVADGSAMMGSLRNPAAWCDVYGFRPSVGLVPGENRERALTHRLSTNGPMARTLADLEALLGRLSDGVFQSADAPETPRIGWLGDWGGAYPMEPGLIEVAEQALGIMETLGWKVDLLPPPCPQDMLWESWTTLRSFVVAQDLRAYWQEPVFASQLNEQAHFEVNRGRSMTGDQVADAAAMRDQWLLILEGLFQRFDALVLPSTQVWPFPAEWDWPTQINGTEMDSYHRWMEIVIPASLAGVPVLNVPAGYGDDGLPAGIQIMGRQGSDATLLALGRAYEDAVGPRQIRP